MGQRSDFGEHANDSSLAKEIDSVDNRELRISRVTVAPGGHILAMEVLSESLAVLRPLANRKPRA